MLRRACRLRILPLFFASTSLAQVFGPSGGEFRVNTTTTGSQDGPAIGVDALGRFLIAWSGPDGDGDGTFARRFSHNGVPIDATDFRVNTSTASDEGFASVAVSQSLAFDAVVGWQRGDFFAQRFDSSGALGGNFQVNTTGVPTHTSTAMDGSGSWVAVWNDGADITGQRYNSAGTKLGGEFTVASAVGSGAQCDVARAPAGPFVVVWTDTASTIAARRYSAAGAPLDSGFQVNTFTTNGTGTPVVAMNDDRFVVSWTLSDSSDPDVRARVFDNGGSSITADFRVNTYTTGTQFDPEVGIANDDSFVVVFVDRTNRDGGGPVDGGSVWARRFSATPTALGSEFRVNTYTTGGQGSAVVAMQANGDFVVAWASPGNASSNEVLAQRYCHALAGDANNDNALSVSDVFYLINNLFAGGPAPLNNSDTNGDGHTDVADVFYLINYLFAAGPGPQCPLPLF